MVHALKRNPPPAVSEGSAILLEGAFLLEAVPSQGFTPEDFTTEHRLVRETARSFFESQVAPKSARLDSLDEETLRDLLLQGGELGLFGAGIPERDGGSGADPIPPMLELQEFTRHGSFAMAFATHSGVGSLPLVFFGSEEQKRRYLPGILSGETPCGFALTEAHSGSDAFSARTTARWEPARSAFMLDGEKLWVTNAGIAELFTVFARGESGELTAFLVERDRPGVRLGPEEEKMGMRGSSTRALFLHQVEVPTENVLGAVGGGHRIVFTTLNLSRVRMGAGLVGAAREVLSLSTRYSSERRVSGRPLSEWGLSQEKLARMAGAIYGLESAVYRTGGLLASELERSEDAGMEPLVQDFSFVMECSMVKVLASETYDFVADEGVQLHGANGYSAAFAVERHYRDARVTRIFEGANEIHRPLIAERLMKLAASPLFRPEVECARRELAGASGLQAEVSTGPLSPELALLDRSRKVTLLLTQAARDVLGSRLGENQLLAASIADIATETFLMASALGRTVKTARLAPGPGPRDARAEMTSLAVFEAFERAASRARRALGLLVAEGGPSDLVLMIEPWLQLPVTDPRPRYARVSRSVVEAGGYPLP